MKTIAIHNALPGMMITRITQQNGPVKIRKSGLITSEAMIQGLIEMGVQTIEFDPDQTVEIVPSDSARAVTTPTQALIRGQFDSQTSRTDAAINEQFNRSLFLPTINSLPSRWRRAFIPVGVYGLLAIGGLAFGYAMSQAPHWYRWYKTSMVTTQPTAQTPSAGLSSTVQEGDVQKPERVADKPVMTDNSGQVSASLPAEPLREEPVNILNENPDAEVTVSPELMAKFNQVLEDLQQEERSGESPSTRAVVNVHDDVKRIDQLPAHILTRLPAMNFSAHMYATLPRDRWVRVNGLDLAEGDWIDDRVEIVNIEAQRVVLRFEGQVFGMTALTDW